MMRLILFICVSALLGSCTSRPQPPRNEGAAPPSQRSWQLSYSYPLGMTRKDLRKELASSCLFMSASRPPTGWSRQVSPPAGERAMVFESSKPGTIVEACDVYWIGHTNAPKMYYGKRLDYFYFDRDEKLIGFDWRIID
jgi:hypothetical protein